MKVFGNNKTLYNYRNISFEYAANVDVSNITHKLSEEEDELSGSYYGFLAFEYCADVKVSHYQMFARKYSKTGNSTYDFNLKAVVNATCEYLECNDISNPKRWGIMGTYYCKDITYNHCTLNCIDAHNGIYNLNINDSIVGYWGLYLLGQGTLNVNNTTVIGRSFLVLRNDYGSTWNGDVNFIDCTFKCVCGQYEEPIIINVYPRTDEDGTLHDYGYEYQFPNAYFENFTIIIDNEINHFVGKYATLIPNYKYDLYDPEKLPDSYWPDYIYMNGTLFVGDNADEWYVRVTSTDFANINTNVVITNLILKLDNESGEDKTSKFNLGETFTSSKNVYLKIDENHSMVNSITVEKDGVVMNGIPNSGEIEGVFEYLFTEDGNYRLILSTLQSLHNRTGQKVFEFSIDKSSSVMRGDLDNDGEINIIDVRLLLQEYINSSSSKAWSEEELAVMDVNEDGTVDILDVRLLLQIYINQ